eukprot:7881545-Pyramimonas_sp.AAC.1
MRDELRRVEGMEEREGRGLDWSCSWPRVRGLSPWPRPWPWPRGRGRSRARCRGRGRDRVR